MFEDARNARKIFYMVYAYVASTRFYRFPVVNQIPPTLTQRLTTTTNKRTSFRAERRPTVYDSPLAKRSTLLHSQIRWHARSNFELWSFVEEMFDGRPEFAG